MTFIEPVKPIPILFDLHDVPNWVPNDYITDEGTWLNMAFIPVPNTYTSLIVGHDGTSLRTLGRCTSTVIEMKPYGGQSMLVIYGLERLNTRTAFNRLVTIVKAIQNKVDTDNDNGYISNYCLTQ